MTERQVIATWFTPEEKLPPEDWSCVVTYSGTDGNINYDHVLGIGNYWINDGWCIENLSDEAEFIVHAWSDIDPYGGKS
jgi:hypothetical protein